MDWKSVVKTWKSNICFYLSNVYLKITRTITIEKSLTSEFICTFDFSMYPFDHQICFIEVLSNKIDDQFVKLVQDTLIYTGPHIVNQYDIEPLEFIDSEKDNAIRIQIKFHRRIYNKLLNVGLPTILTNLVSIFLNLNMHSLIRGVLIQSCPAGAKNFTNYIFWHPQFSGVIQNIENRCAIRAKFWKNWFLLYKIFFLIIINIGK